MFTKVHQIVVKNSQYILAPFMVACAIWLNIYALNIADKNLTPLTSLQPSDLDHPVKTVSSTIAKSLSKTIQTMSTHRTSPEEISIVEELTDLTGPELYASYVDQITTEIYPDVPADYIKAIIWHESRYKPDVINSNSGVKGLMQISPKWHTKRAERLGVDDLLDPYGNILVGCDILNEMTQRYGFSYALNYYAGGFDYADAHMNSSSQFEKELMVIIERIESGDIQIGGE